MNTTEFWRQVDADLQRLKSEIGMRRMIVSSVDDDGLVHVTEVDGSPHPGAFVNMSIETLVVGQEVMAQPIASRRTSSAVSSVPLVVIGPVRRSSPMSVIHKINGSRMSLINELDLVGFSDDEITERWRINGSDGSAIFGSLNTPIPIVDAQSGSDTVSTSSTTVYSQAITTTVTLPFGVWSIDVAGGLAVKHSTGGNVSMGVEVDGQMSAIGPSAGADNYRWIEDVSRINGIAGNRDVSVRIMYRAQSVGTASAANPRLIGMARRTA